MLGSFLTMDEDGTLPLLHRRQLVEQGPHGGRSLQAQLIGCLDIGRRVLQVLEGDDGEVGGLQ